MEIKSPVKGIVKTLKSVNDGVFSENMLGEGVAIEPKDNVIYAPIKGRLVTVFPTAHAYGIESKDGTSVLIHIGVDTVNLKGEGFKSLVEQGKKIKQGAPLAEVMFDDIKDKVPSIDVIMVVLNESKTKVASKTEEGEVTLESTLIVTN